MEQLLRRRKGLYGLFIALMLAFLPVSLRSQISFTNSLLSNATVANPTSLQFGPDGRLYVAQANGFIKIFTVVKNGTNSYSVTATETVTLINSIPNHNDDGSLAPSVTTRQVTGILVVGTAAQPMIYVSSSDSRVGGPDGDLNLDTNSGIVSLLTWTGSAWTKLDLIRGLPRSEENHSVNGMQLDASTNTLLLCVGGITNAGSPSINFAYTCEYALSAAILSIDLNAVNALPTQGSGNSAFKYDLPTVDDPTRSNVGSADVNDPFGGNDGLNMARIVPGGPVQIFSPGYRNAYDILITKTPGKAGRIYTIDNGANPGWGGYPENEGPGGNVTNNYVTGEPGSTGPGINEAQVDNLDGLHFIGNIGTYVKGSYYGGHPDPIRANPNGAGLYTNNGTTGVFRTSKTGANPLPADWPPVAAAHAVEGDFLMPGSSASPSLLTFTNSTNGLAEYTASNFNNAMKGNLLSVDYGGNMWLIKLSADGTTSINNKNASTKLIQDAPLAANFGQVPLDVIAQGDTGPFPGTLWVAVYQSNTIQVFEPQDGVTCTGQNNNQDDDNDGYTNADEIANGTNPCSASSKPPDFDQDHVSDLNDPDDDNDGINDNVDLFPIDAKNGTGTFMPVLYPMFSNQPGTGFFGLGFTGLMSNKQAANDYLKTFDPNNLVAGGAAGVLSVVAVSAKDALGTTNNQENAFQFGVNTSSGVPFTVNSRMLGPFFNNQTPAGGQSQGIYVGTGDQSNYLKITLNANGGAGGIQVVTENTDVPVTNQYALSAGLSSISTIDLYLSVNPVAGTVQPAYAINGGTKVNLGSPITVSGALLNVLRGSAATAVGIISTSVNATPFTASWDYLNVIADTVSSTWVTVAPSHTPKWVGYSIMYDNKMWVFSGFDSSNLETTPHVEMYNPATNVWTNQADMPFPVTHAGITVDGSTVYVAGGFLDGNVGGANSNKLQIFNMATNVWSQGPVLPAVMGGNALVRVGRKLHAFGGLLADRQTGNTAHYVLDLTNIAAGWTNAAPTPLPRCHFSSSFVAGKIYTIGGQEGHDGAYHDVNYVQVYDPSTDTWAQLANMPIVRSHIEPSTFVMEGKIYFVGGRSGADNNILGTVTSYDPATGTFADDVPLPTGVTLFGCAAEAIGAELFVANGGLNNCCAPQTTTRKRGITRIPNMKIGFLPTTLNLTVAASSTTSKKVLLWTLSGNPSFTIAALPAWLTVVPSSGTIDLLGGTEITITANSSGLAAGNYSATVTASAAGYPDATLQVNLTVTAANQKVLYLYGSVPPGEVDMKLADTGPTGMSQFATALQQVGFTCTEALDASVTLNAATLSPYKVLILGSNNRRFTAAEQAAVATWVNAGGGLVAWSDAAFDWVDGGVNSYGGQLSDNDLTQQFGMKFLHDNGSNVFTLNQWAVNHYINNFNKNGGLSIRAEGVSPVRTTAPATIVANMPAGSVLNSLDGSLTAADAVLSVAKPGSGRVASFCDRNTFWNAGDGTTITEVDNKVFAQRLILWASGVPDTQPSNGAVYRINAGGPGLTNSIGTFAADNFFSPAPGFTFSTTAAIAGTTDDAMYQTERSSTTSNGVFSYAFPVTNGTYKVVLHFAEIYWTAAGQRKFDVSIEGVKVLDNFDIFQKVGANTADIENFTTTVTDGTLNINFTAAVSEGGVDQPKVSAIEILNTTAANQAPVANAGLDTTIVLPASTAILRGSGTDADGTVTGYNWTKVSGSGTIASPTSATTNVTGLTQGTSVFQLVVTDNQGATSAADQVIVTVNAAGTTTMYRINAGGPAITNSIGTFAADNFFSPAPGFIFSTTSAIAGTTDDAMYQTERSATTDNGTFSYAFPVNNGNYKVVLHFAEIYWTAVGQRKFDVSIEGVKVLDNFDIFQKVGANTADIENFTTTVTDGTLNINFTAAVSEGGVDRPKISAIEILPQSGSALLAAAFDSLNQSLQAPATDTARVYPNPSRDGWFKVMTTMQFHADAEFILMSSSGATLKRGKLPPQVPGTAMWLDFSREMRASGVYYLRLMDKNRLTVLKLMRE
ncbi:malectin domain-containing carbohydrate-binding protein [Puia sp.]|uniref:malectin domain-containing carbohydrate-binding protein n=1 Tax=Puia sp. TaxID=2045100 RepID=UPI002F3F6EA7